MSILVTAASGQLGSLVVKSLIEKVSPEKLHVASRNLSKLATDIPSSIHRHQADFNDVASLTSAMKDIEKVLLISSDSPGQRVAQHKNVVDCARKSGVKLIVYTSLLRADSSSMKLAKEHKETEEYIKASGIPFVFLRNGWYIENLTSQYANWVSHGAIVGAFGAGRISAATRADYAEAAAVVLAKGDHSGKIYELGGDKAFSGEELAKVVSKQCGKDVKWSSISPEAYVQMLTGFGVPAVMADILGDADMHAASGGLEENSGTLSKLIGRKTTSMEEVVKACASK